MRATAVKIRVGELLEQRKQNLVARQQRYVAPLPPRHAHAARSRGSLRALLDEEATSQAQEVASFGETAIERQVRTVL